MSVDLIMRNYNEVTICQRRGDRYLDATAMCRATGKRWNDYWRLGQSQEFVTELSAVTGIPATELVQVRQGGVPEQQGTWVHPRLAINLAQWCSPRFAVLVAGWVEELLTTGSVALDLDPLDALAQMVTAMQHQRRQIQIANQTADRALAVATAVQEQQQVLSQTADGAHRLAQAAVDIHSSNYGFYSVLAWCSLHNLACDHKRASIHGRRLSKICRAAGRPMSTVRDARWGEVHTYPEDVLRNYFNETADK